MNSQKYRELRQLISETVCQLPALDARNVQIREIDHLALESQTQWCHAEGQGIGWDWYEIMMLYRRDEVDRVDMAIWADEILTGLALGKVSAGKLVVRVNFLEANGDKAHPLKGLVFPIVDTWLEQYAVALGAEYIGVQEPYEGVKDYYRQFGYEDSDPFDPRNNAMVRRVEIDQPTEVE